jgi:aryl carrier-like protein
MNDCDSIDVDIMTTKLSLKDLEELKTGLDSLTLVELEESFRELEKKMRRADALAPRYFPYDDSADD